jgi:hypothetical protein
MPFRPPSPWGGKDGKMFDRGEKYRPHLPMSSVLLGVQWGCSGVLARTGYETASQRAPNPDPSARKRKTTGFWPRCRLFSFSRNRALAFTPLVCGKGLWIRKGHLWDWNADERTIWAMSRECRQSLWEAPRVDASAWHQVGTNSARTCGRHRTPSARRSASPVTRRFAV